MKGDIIELIRFNPRLLQTVLHGLRRKGRIVLPPGETLLLRCGLYYAVL
jgi:hypothetical protein